jgi:hypothetical protein
MLRGAVAGVAIVVTLIFIPRPTEIRFVYSSDAKGLLGKMIKTYNENQNDVVIIGDGSEPSGKVLDAILAGTEMPDIWMPAASTWGRLLNRESGMEIAPLDSPSFFWSPQVIGTFSAVADDVRIDDWKDIADLAMGNVRVGDGEPFRLGHTKPSTSTSGLYALVSEFSSVDPQGEPIVDPRSIEQVRSIEEGVLHYGDIADDFCDRLFEYSSAYVSALYMQETTLLKCKERPRRPVRGLTEVFPDRTFIADYPAFVLNADWVSPSDADGAEGFIDWLGENLDRQRVVDEKFRFGDPWDGIEDPAPPGADRSQKWSPLAVPSARTLSAVRGAWTDVRKPSDVMILLQTGDMHIDSKIDAAKELLRTFISDLPDGTRVGLNTFAEEVHPEAALRTLNEQHRADLLAALDGIAAGPSNSLLADALMRSIADVDDPNRISVIVLVSLGDLHEGRWTTDDVQAELKRLSRRTTPVQVFTTSYGFRHGDQVLYDITTAALGDCADAKPEGDKTDRCEGETTPRKLLDLVTGIV